MHGTAASCLKPKEKIVSHIFCDFVLSLAIKLSYRETCTLLDKILINDAGEHFRLMTVADFISRHGKDVDHEIRNLVGSVLESNGFDKDTGLPLDVEALPGTWKQEPPVPQDHDVIIRKCVDEINEGRTDIEKIRDSSITKCLSTETDADNCVYINIDDIGVKRQKLHRSVPRGADEAATVQNTVIHVQYGEESFTFNSSGMQSAMCLLTAFLLNNNLLENKRLIFISDGAAIIKDYIRKFFCWRPYTLCLDWYHLSKKSREYISGAIAGDIGTKKTYIRQFLRILWAGEYDSAMEYLDSLGKDAVKNNKVLKAMSDYIGRKSENICCYALRAKLGLINSSARGEKDNHILVAQRQKHNGMAWSCNGSYSLGLITSVYKNGFEEEWIRDKSIRLEFGSRKIA